MIEPNEKGRRERKRVRGEIGPTCLAFGKMSARARPPPLLLTATTFAVTMGVVLESVLILYSAKRSSKGLLVRTGAQRG